MIRLNQIKDNIPELRKQLEKLIELPVNALANQSRNGKFIAGNLESKIADIAFAIEKLEDEVAFRQQYDKEDDD